MLPETSNLALALLDQGTRETLVVLLREADVVGFRVCESVLEYELSNPVSRFYTVHKNDLTMLERIPSRFARRAFDRVAVDLARALNEWPSPVIVQPTGSPDTLARCLREAIEAKKRYGYKIPGASDALFNEYEPHLVVSIDKDTATVVIGERNAVKAALPKISEAVAVRIEHSLSPDEPTLRAVCALLSKKSINPVPLFSVKGSDPSLRNILEAQFDVAFVPDEKEQGKFYLS